MDGWMTCDFTSFSTVFQSYQDDGRLIMKDCAMKLRLPELLNGHDIMTKIYKEA